MKGPRRHRGRFLRILAGAQVGVSLFALAGCFETNLSLFAHFQLYLGACWVATWLLVRFVPKVGGAFWRPGLVQALAITMVLCHSAVMLWTMRPPQVVDLEDPSQLSMMWFNVHHDEMALRAAEAYLAKDPPDIICLGEMSADMDWRLPGYAFRHRAPKGDVLIASRWPLEEKRVVGVPGGREVISAEVVVERRRFTLITAHSRVPTRNSHRPALRQIAAWAADPDQCVVMGDLNSTPWAAEFRDLERVGGLQHARRGQGYLSSWGMLPGKFMRLPIDHALGKGDLNLKNFRLMPWMYSDHRGFVVDLELGGKRGHGAREQR